MCSVFGQLARGITGGSTESNKSGNVPEILGRLDFGLSTSSLSITISGYIKDIQLKLIITNFAQVQKHQLNYRNVRQNGDLR